MFNPQSVQFHYAWTRGDVPGVVYGKFGNATCSWDRPLTEAEQSILLSVNQQDQQPTCG